MVRRRKSHPKSQNSTLAPSSADRSVSVMPPNGNGETVAADPSTKNTLNTQLPTTLPIARP